MKNFLSGGLAGVVAKSTVEPIDRIKIFYMVPIKNRLVRKSSVISVS